jgi:HEAT repeat protein
MGEQATPALRKCLRLKIRAFAPVRFGYEQDTWQRRAYIDKALTDSDEDVRIAAIRARRQLPGDIIPFIKKLQNDPSAQIRRELLIAIHRSGSPEVPAIWSALASTV